jgi:hypothetical protein
MASNGGMVMIGTLISVWKEADIACFKVLFQHLPGGTGENHNYDKPRTESTARRIRSRSANQPITILVFLNLHKAKYFSAYKFVPRNIFCCDHICIGTRFLIGDICTLAETKIGRFVYSNSPPGGTVVIRILQFFVVLYILFLPSHRYRTKHNRSCQLLLNVRM